MVVDGTVGTRCLCCWVHLDVRTSIVRTKVIAILSYKSTGGTTAPQCTAIVVMLDMMEMIVSTNESEKGSSRKGTYDGEDHLCTCSGQPAGVHQLRVHIPNDRLY